MFYLDKFIASGGWLEFKFISTDYRR